jgi:two-component system sensor histidine kinase PilS (NtrC family)
MTPTSIPEEDPGLRRRLVYYIGGRMIAATLLVGGSLLLSGESAFGAYTRQALSTLFAATFAMSAIALVLLRKLPRLSLLAGVQLAWDLGIVTALVYFLGGAASAFAFLYGVVILAAALVVGPRATQTTTAGALLAFTSMGLAAANGWVEPPPDHPELAYDLPLDQLALALLRNIVGFILVGLLASGLSERLRKTGGELRAAEASAAEYARLNEDILRSMTSGVLTADPEGRIRVINPAGAAMLGAGPEALVGERADRFLPGIGSQAPPRAEGDATRADGSRFPVGFSVSPLSDASGAVLGSLVVFQDLTELNELRAKAERAERLAALGRLSAGLAHEIRNPLGSISGSVEMVREARELAEEDRRLLTIVLGEVERLNDLVTTMLDVGRPRAPELASVDLGALASEVASVARKGAQANVGVELPPEPLIVTADPAQIRQVLWNLVKNACQFSPAGAEVRVAVGQEGRRAFLRVKDEGPGIAPEDRAHLFEMFFTKRKHGVGLGLALVRQIVDAHGGEISVETELGRGTTFTVYLPGDRRSSASATAS